MPVNPNWTRWIVASLATYFGEIADVQNLPLLVDGIDERDAEKLRSRVELRISGPFVREPSKDYFYVEVGVNLLLTDIMSDTQNPYRLMSFLGAFQEAAAKTILLHKYGPTPAVDDQSYFGCLIPRGESKDASKTYQYGQVSVRDHVRQASIDTMYYLEPQE